MFKYFWGYGVYQVETIKTIDLTLEPSVRALHDLIKYNQDLLLEDFYI